MNTVDQYKDEALRLLDHYPLDVCERVAKRLQGRGWKLDKFDCKVEIFDTIRWYAKVHIKTDVTKVPMEKKWEELKAIFLEQDMEASLVVHGFHSETEVVSHRKYERPDVMGGRRVLLGHWYDFHVEFKPVASLAISVLTEEEA
jgi:hypothetical protein